MTNISVQLENTEAEQLKKVAKQEKLTSSEMARKAVRYYLTNTHIESAQKIGQKIAHDLGIKTERDIEKLFK